MTPILIHSIMITKVTITQMDQLSILMVPTNVILQLLQIVPLLSTIRIQITTTLGTTSTMIRMAIRIIMMTPTIGVTRVIMIHTTTTIIT
jgi:hypothetical protein